jgi:hypothetical protein
MPPTPFARRSRDPTMAAHGPPIARPRGQTQ